MNLNEALVALQAAGSEKTRQTYARHGVAREMYGVSYADLEKLRRTIKTDDELAKQLWQTGNHDARALATMIADPAQASSRTLEAWIKELDHSLLSSGISRLASKSPSAAACFERWSQSKNDFVSCSAWMTLAALAARDSTLSDDYYEKQIQRIERQIQKAKNETRYAMNAALIAIGGRNAALEKSAINAAQRMGKVQVDHGDTACKTPDAVAYIKKIAGRRKKAKK